LRGLCEHLSEMADRVRQVVKQTRVRVFDGITQMAGKIVSLFEPHTEIIRKGKASKPTEFGKLAQVQETENQIITHYGVFDRRPSDRDLLSGAVETHERVLGRMPILVTADAGYYSRAQEQAVEEKGVKWITLRPLCSLKSLPD
jgi:IS5 family transposase